jgi:hypothetical protein
MNHNQSLSPNQQNSPAGRQRRTWTAPVVTSKSMAFAENGLLPGDDGNGPLTGS